MPPVISLRIPLIVSAYPVNCLSPLALCNGNKVAEELLVLQVHSETCGFAVSDDSFRCKMTPQTVNDVIGGGEWAQEWKWHHSIFCLKVFPVIRCNFTFFSNHACSSSQHFPFCWNFNIGSVFRVLILNCNLLHRLTKVTYFFSFCFFLQATDFGVEC